MEYAGSRGKKRAIVDKSVESAQIKKETAPQHFFGPTKWLGTIDQSTLTKTSSPHRGRADPEQAGLARGVVVASKHVLQIPARRPRDPFASRIVILGCAPGLPLLRPIDNSRLGWFDRGRRKKKSKRLLL